MPLEYDIDPVDHLVQVRIHGTIAIDDIARLLDKIRQEMHLSHRAVAIIDARELKRAFFIRETDNLIQLMLSKQARYIREYAFIIAGDLVTRVGKRFLLRARRAGLKLSIYGDQISAMAQVRHDAD